MGCAACKGGEATRNGNCQRMSPTTTTTNTATLEYGVGSGSRRRTTKVMTKQTPSVGSPEVSSKIGPQAIRVGARRSLTMSRVKRAATLFENYDVSNTILGTGISGAVRVATSRQTNRRFAIKTLSLQNISAKKAAMLHNEVSIYLQLDHPNIAKLIEVYEDDSAVHLVMELCTGRELYDRLALKKKYSEADAAKVALQMLEAVNYCHKHRICHRDLKLENWVYADPSEDAPLKLIDFGFSRIFNPGIPMTAMHGTVYYVSPEVMDGCYKEKCDIWSIGVIVYMLLSGSPPFNGSYDHEILIKIKRASFSFEGSRWEGISEEAKSFISYLLVKDPNKRPSAEESLQHDWLRSRNTENTKIDIDVLRQMRRFAVANSMKRAALGMIALTMNTQEVENLEIQFKALDTNNTGTILLQELASILVDKLQISQQEAKKIFERVDQSGDQEVHYSEFIASTLQLQILQNENVAREAFQRFDVDGNGLITVEDLRQVLGDTYAGARVEDIVKFCDHKGNNVIDYEEFLAAITSDEVPIDTRNPIEIEDSCEVYRTFSKSLNHLRGLKECAPVSGSCAGSPVISHSPTNEILRVS